jgi:hypothetical protein
LLANQAEQRQGTGISPDRLICAIMKQNEIGAFT